MFDWKRKKRINSYIVGCKSGTDTNKNLKAVGINSYIVGCKL